MKSKTGTLYMLEDVAYPDYIALGWTTDSEKKLTYHNANRALPNQCKIMWESEWLTNVNGAHAYITKKITRNPDYKKVPAASNRWHHVDNQALIDRVIQDFIDSGYRMD